MKYRITHITRYRSMEPVSLGMNRVCLIPRQTRWQKTGFSRVVTAPHPTVSDRRTDYFGNTVEYLSFERGYINLDIRSFSRVMIEPRQLPELNATPAWQTLDMSSEAITNALGVNYNVAEMAVPSRLVRFDRDTMQTYARESFPQDRPILSALADLLSRFAKDFDFDSTATTVNTPVDEVFEKKKGVCQDFAHTLIAMLRSLNIAARYVSGYIRTHPPEGQPRLRGADASHAWVSVYCGDIGWVDIDPTNNCFVSDEHVTVAWGRDYSDVAPVKGVVIGAGNHTLDVSVDMEPIEEPGD